MKTKLIRITTVPLSFKVLLKGQPRFMASNGFDVIGVTSEGPEFEEITRQECIPFVALPMSRKITPVADLLSLWRMYQLFKKERPDIVHTHTPKAGIVGMLAARLAGVPIRMHTVAGLPLMEAKGVKRTVLDAVEKLTYRCATHVYPNSKGLMDFIKTHHLTEEAKLKVIANGSSNGINTHYFSPEQITSTQKAELRTSLKLQESDFVFIFVGRLVSDKGINELIRAFESIDHLNAKLLLVGPLETELDPLDQYTLDVIANNSNIVYVGFQHDVRPYFAISDALVFPSYREGFPNVVMQAGAMGLPCIVSDINGCNEIIEEGCNGTIIPVKNEIALKERMTELLENVDYYNRLKENARVKIQSRYEQTVIWSALLEEYKQLIKH